MPAENFTATGVEQQTKTTMVLTGKRKATQGETSEVMADRVKFNLGGKHTEVSRALIDISTLIQCSQRLCRTRGVKIRKRLCSLIEMVTSLATF